MSQLALTLLMLFSDMGNREDMRFAHCFEQGYDLSCGFSALATLLCAYWGRDSGEAELLSRYGDGTGAVSMRDLQGALRGEGFAAEAYRIDFARLIEAARLWAPVIAHYDRPEGHFVLVLAIVDGMVVVSDPALGTAAMDAGDFLKSWSGAVILARPRPAEPAQPGQIPPAGLSPKAAGFLESAVSSALGRLELLVRRQPPVYSADGGLSWR